MGIDPLEFYNILAKSDISFFTGVPDSLLKQFGLCVDDHVPEDRHIIAANEGNAIALALGRYLGTGKPALVYMQNSGFSNAINPLVSLADAEVYGIPMLLMVVGEVSPVLKMRRSISNKAGLRHVCSILWRYPIIS